MTVCYTEEYLCLEGEQPEPRPSDAAATRVGGRFRVSPLVFGDPECGTE